MTQAEIDALVEQRTRQAIRERAVRAGRLGGQARKRNLSPERLREIALAGVEARRARQQNPASKRFS